MASSSSSHQRNEEHHAFSGFEPPGRRRKISESSRLFDVFINHRGPDVRETLATNLYKSLEKLGIRAFLNSRDVGLGDTISSAIEAAIRSAAVHVAIFSERFAESPWCLAELVFMFQTRAKIIPVFYNVKPWELRHIEKGVYAEAFIMYEKKGRYLEKLKEWKEALQSASLITGHEFNGDWENVVSTVQKEVQRLKSFHVAKYPVGLDEVVQDFERKCLNELGDDFEHQRGMEEVKGKGKIVGIFGMGGMGKTTLSKELFNRKQSQFNRACFLFDVREASAKGELHSLQLKLLKDLFDDDQPRFQSTEEGMKYIENCIRKSSLSNFLIVVDDIDHVRQLDVFFIMDMLNMSSNTLIIVTTRDVGVLISAGISIRYNLKGFNRDAARELFCWHAFRQPYPASGYNDLVEAFLDECGGLPLSLQILGMHVHGRDQNYWTLELNKINKMLPRDILHRLKKSFDSLNSEEKEIFMDTACFFIGEDKSTAITAWEGSGRSTQHALQTLIDKCLVEEIEIQGHVGPVLRMHDHLRDLGREMANELWHPKEIKSLEDQAFSGIEPPGHSMFDVFINHRGPDVKESLALQLCHYLQDLGIGAFLDSSDKEIGDSFPSKIKTVIYTAAVHIAIFSKRYAESPSCLEELALMLQSKGKIIPVFYGVHPWELRYIENGAYGEAFSKYKKKGRFLNKLGIWKEALQAASLITVLKDNNSTSDSFISGLHFKDLHALCDGIASRVLKETSLFVAKSPVSPSQSVITETSPVSGMPNEISETFLFVAKYPVGLDVLVDDFTKQCRRQEEKVNIIGIFGMGGCGKTTLAKEVFNQMHSTYDRSCFLFDSRETDVKCELISLQTRLVKDLFPEDFKYIPKFQSSSEGTMYLRKRLRESRSLRFLIVLDNIEHVDQLEALLPIDGLRFSGMALVTTRDERVLINAGITERYKMKEMSPDSSRELFCLHAFHRRDPEPGYEDLVEMFLKECGGLPLSLREMGVQLSGITDKFYWELQLDKIRKMLPADVKKRLKVSFDALDSEEKEIFMDIGCFFIGKPKAMAIRIWQGSGWSAEHAFQTLKHKCLVEVTQEEMNKSKEFEYEDGLVIRMHNHLAQLGREEADERMRRPRRLWRTEDLKTWEFEEFQKILIETKGKSLRCFNSIFDWSIRITYFLASSEGLAETFLVWLELDLEEKSLTSIPPWIPMQNLQGLKICNGGLQRLWQGPLQTSQFQAPLQLKRLVLDGISSLKELKSTEMLPLLEDLVLSGDLLLTATMVMEGTSLSESLRKLTNLKLLVLRQFTLNGELALSNGGKPTSSEPPMSKLEKIEITTVELLSKVSVCGDYCPNLKSLKISGMEDLIEVDLTGVKTLKCLKLEYCTEMKTVSGICDLENLVMLYLLDCPKLEKLPSLAHMSGLESIMVDKCPKLQNIEGIEKLEGLKYLHISTVDGSISDGAVWNCIHSLKRLPAITSVIGRAVNEAESILNPGLFSDKIEPTAVTDIQMIEKGKVTSTVKMQESLSAIIVCAVVECYDESLDIEIPFPSNHFVISRLPSHLPVGEWVVTIAIAGDTGITYAPDYIAQSSWISNMGPKDPEIKKGYILAVKEGQERQNLFEIIMENLYHKGEEPVFVQNLYHT